MTTSLSVPNLVAAPVPTLLKQNRLSGSRSRVGPRGDAEDAVPGGAVPGTLRVGEGCSAAEGWGTSAGQAWGPGAAGLPSQPGPRWSLSFTHRGRCAAPPDTAFFPSGDGDIVNNMYEPDPDLLAGESAEDETEDSIMSPIPMGPASPFPTSEDFTPKEGSPYEAPVYIPEDIPIPPDFELRESSIPGAGLGIWAKKRMEIGERFGPYMVAPRATLKEADFGWEVSLLRRRD